MPLADLPEFLLRRAYFSLPAVVAWYQRRKTRGLEAGAASARWDPPALRRLLESEIPRGADLMLHSSMAGLGASTSPQDVLDSFLEFCRGDLLIPSHPRLRAGLDGVLEYDPRRAPSTVGLVSELARRAAGFQRSRHPISAVAVRGPAAAFYLENNLNESRPLPHGVDSPYARLAERGGYAVCLGVPFDKCLTMIHVSEETLDAAFPRAIRFDELRVRVLEAGGDSTWTVRVRSRKMLPFVSMRQILRDLPAIGAVRRFTVGGTLVDIVDCGHVVRFMRERAADSGYPYVCLRRRSG